MIIGFTGTRRGMTPFQLQRLLGWLIEGGSDVREAQHGDCVGADAQFHTLCLARMIPVSLHPASGVGAARAYCSHYASTQAPKPPLERNHTIVDTSHIVIVAPGESQEVLRSGTWATWRYAKKVGKQILFLDPVEA